MDSRDFKVGIPKEAPKEEGSGPENEEEQVAAEQKITPGAPKEPKEPTPVPEMVIEKPGTSVKQEEKKEDIEQEQLEQIENRGELNEGDVAFNDDVHTTDQAARLLDEVNKLNS